MATEWQSFPIAFTGGLVTNLSSLQQGINAIGSASILQNFEPSLDGGYKKVLGYEKFVSAQLTGSGVIQGLAIVQLTGNKKVIAVRNGVYKIINKSDTTPAWATLGTASNTSFTKVRHVTYDFEGANKICFVDGVNYPAYYTTSSNAFAYLSSGVAANAAVSAATDVTVFKSSLFFAVSSSIVFSAPYTSDDFSVANGAGTIDMGSPVVKVIPYRDQLIIFCRDKILRLTGSSAADYVLNPITEDIGCTNVSSVQEIGTDIMFLAPDGLRTLSSTDRIGDFGLDVATKNIRPTISKLQGYASDFASMVIRDKAQYRLFAYVGAERDSVSRGVLGTKFIDQGGTGFQWAEIKGFKVYVADSKYIDEVEYRLFANTDGYIYSLDVGLNRDGDAIEAIYKSPFMPLTDPQLRKTFYKLDLYIEPSAAIDIDVTLKYNQGDTTYPQPSPFSITRTVGGTGLYGDNSTIFNTAVFGTFPARSYSTNINGSAKNVAINIEDKGSNTGFLLDTAVFEYAVNDRQ